jgi:hypothetical protein
MKNILRKIADKFYAFAEKSLRKSNKYLEISANLINTNYYYLALFLARLYTFQAEQSIQIMGWISRLLIRLP